MQPNSPMRHIQVLWQPQRSRYWLASVALDIECLSAKRNWLPISYRHLLPGELYSQKSASMPKETHTSHTRTTAQTQQVNCVTLLDAQECLQSVYSRTVQCALPCYVSCQCQAVMLLTLRNPYLQMTSNRMCLAWYSCRCNRRLLLWFDDWLPSRSTTLLTRVAVRCFIHATL